MGKFEEKLLSLGKVLPGAARPVATYVPAVGTGELIFTSGQLPFVDGALAETGIVGETVSVERARELAEICALNALSAIKQFLGELDRLSGIVKVTGFVASVAGFTAHPQVIDGASDLLKTLFETGHARSAIGVASLPLNSPVELELIAAIKNL